MAGRARRGDFNLMSSFDYYSPKLKGLLGFVLMFLLGVLIANMLGVGFVFASMKGVLPQNFLMEYGQLIIYPLMFIPAMMFAASRSRRNQLFDLPRKPLDGNGFGRMGGILCALCVSMLTLSMAFLLDPLSLVLPPMDEKTRAAMEMMLHGPLLVNLLCVSIMAPIFEEWLCRGIIMRSLLGVGRPWVAIVLSSAFFALIHFNLWQAIPAFIIGLLLGWVYYRTGSLKLTMLMHCVNNTFSLAISRIPSLKDYETFNEMMGGWSVSYIVSLLGCLLAAAFCIYIFNRDTSASASGREPSLPTSSSSSEEGM